jgi:hypothetical protein
LRARGVAALEQEPAWLAPLCARLRERFDEAPFEVELLRSTICDDEALRTALPDHVAMPRIRRWFFPSPRMAPRVGALAAIDVLPIETEADLAQLLSISPTELAWFADLKRRNVAALDEPLRHYRHRWVAKRSGGVRLLETPKLRMKAVQRVILRRVLSSIPVDEAAHGFASGRSPQSFAVGHVGKRVVLRMDLEDFFASITMTRVRAIFARLGYPSAVTAALAGLCCVATPRAALRELRTLALDPQERFNTARRLLAAHLPQGAPTSPALSNLVAFKLDRRLRGLTRSLGASYSRYADDLAFSGDRAFEHRIDDFIARVAAIAIDEGFRVRFRKTRVMRSGGRQHLAGLTLNQRLNAPRREVDALRAILHNAAERGAAAQNRAAHPDFRAHLEGRIAWVAATNPEKGARLRLMLASIDWTS